MQRLTGIFPVNRSPNSRRSSRRVGLTGRVTDIGEAARYHSMRTLVAPDGILPATQIETYQIGTSRESQDNERPDCG